MDQCDLNRGKALPPPERTSAVGIATPSIATDTYYQREGCSSYVLAGAMFHAVKHDEDIVLTGATAATVYHLRRISLRLVRAVMAHFSAKAGYL